MRRLTFEEFCHRYCDRMYEPRLPYDGQCNGYIQLKQMLERHITPTTLDDLRFLHHNLRSFILKNWRAIVMMHDVGFVFENLICKNY